LGDDVFILLDIMDEAEKITLAGKVVWIATKGVKRPHTRRVGVQFSDPDNIARGKIETYLAGSLGSSNSTSTM
jgi:type IV pilus assembly protein PilZ|tara:strand:+ start:578 stop:796 length:219 start_codon:yes stop_codon:yes gene_type:complete